VPRRLKQACGAWPVGAWLEVGRPCRCTKTRDGLTSPFTVLLVEIGPEGCTPTQQSPFSLTLRSLPRRVLLPLALRRKMRKLNDTKRKQGNT
jgi:hypothetical protein